MNSHQSWHRGLHEPLSSSLVQGPRVSVCKRCFLDLDKRVGDHHLTRGFISLLSANFVLTFVYCICGRFKSAEKVAWMEDEGGPADLTKAEGRLEKYRQPNIPTTN